MNPKTDLLLNSLTDDARQALQTHLALVELKQHDIIFDAREAIQKVHFPIDAVVSLVLPLATGEVVETAMVGRDGIVGATAALNGRVSFNRAVVQLGGQSLACEIEPLKAVLVKHSGMQAQLAAHEQVLFAQAQQSAACNITHDVKNRLARWLLRASDLRGSNELMLTQEYIAEMLGVRRTSVSVVAHTLQQAGMIQYRRGHITLLDIEALRETACECYETVKLNYDSLQHQSND